MTVKAKSTRRQEWIDVDVETGRLDIADELYEIVPTLIILNEGFDGLRILVWHDMQESFEEAFCDYQDENPDAWERFQRADEDAGFHLLEQIGRQDVVRSA
jgi:hypothetical protein